jgi:hypothetical protein
MVLPWWGRAAECSPSSASTAQMSSRCTRCTTVHGFASLEAAGGFGIKLDLDTSFAHLIDALAAGFGRKE